MPQQSQAFAPCDRRCWLSKWARSTWCLVLVGVVWGTPCGVAMWPCQCILPKYAKMTISYGEPDGCWILGCYAYIYIYIFLIYPTWTLLGYYPDPDARLTQPSSVSACFRLYLCWSKLHMFFNSKSYVSTCVFSKKKCCSFFLINERHKYLSSDPQGRR